MIRDLLPWKKHNDVAVRREREDNPFSLLHRQVNELFDNFFDDFSGSQFLAAKSEICPSFDVTETDDGIEINAELPGMDEKDIDVSLDNNVLTVKGEKKQEHEEKKKDHHVSERSYGMFQRSFSLPSGLEHDRIKANFKNGVLKITMPKSKEAKENRKKIEIQQDQE